MKGQENLKPLGSGALSPEEEKAVRSKGGKKTAFNHKMQKLWQSALSMPMHEGARDHAKSMDDINANLSVGERLVLATLVNYMKTGDPRLLEQIMRYSGAAEPVQKDNAEEEQKESPFIRAIMASAGFAFEDEAKNEEEKK